MSANKLVSYIKSHRCYTHPIFQNWVLVKPNRDVVAALFHQIRSFCDSTRPVHNLPHALIQNGFSNESGLVKSIAESEENHGPQLATMAGYVLNKMGNEPLFDDLYDTETIEAYLKSKSDALLGNLPGYDIKTGLLIQNENARKVFEARKKTDSEILYKNLGTTLALEMISNGHLIPGEKYALLDSNLYPISIEDKEMHYLKEHWGEVGAEAMHEDAALSAISSVINTENEKLIFDGAQEFLDSLLLLWDTLDSSLLGSGYIRQAA